MGSTRAFTFDRAPSSSPFSATVALAGCQPELDDNYGDDGEKNRHPDVFWVTDRLRYALESATLERMGCTINLNRWQQFLVSIAQRYITDYALYSTVKDPSGGVRVGWVTTTTAIRATRFATRSPSA